MKTEEAIKWVNSIVDGIEKVAFGATNDQMKPIKEGAKQIIELLQRGREYKQIVEEMEGYYMHDVTIAVRNIEDDRIFIGNMPAGLRINFKGKEKLIDIANHYLCKYEKYYKVIQKYFPKG